MSFELSSELIKKVNKDNFIESNNQSIEASRSKITLGSFDDQHDLIGKVKRIKKKTTFSEISVFNQRYCCNSKVKFLAAANLNDINTLKTFLLEGFDPNYYDSRGRTAMHFAACKGNVQIAQLLLLHGSDPNRKDYVGNTPLHLAACTNHIQMVTLLLKSGANINTEDKHGRTPLHLARSKLKIIQDCTSYNSYQMKEEAKHIIEMMQIYLTKTGKTEQLIVLNQFLQRLNMNEVGSDLSDILNSISNLSLK